MIRTFVSVALAAAALSAAAPAAAQSDTYLVFVPYGDLDLSTAAGERALQRRLHEAARDTCDAGSTLRERMRAHSCHASFARAALPRIAEARRADGRPMVLAASR